VVKVFERFLIPDTGEETQQKRAHGVAGRALTTHHSTLRRENESSFFPS